MKGIGIEGERVKRRGIKREREIKRDREREIKGEFIYI